MHCVLSVNFWHAMSDCRPPVHSFPHNAYHTRGILQISHCAIYTNDNYLKVKQQLILELTTYTIRRLDCDGQLKNDDIFTVQIYVCFFRHNFVLMEKMQFN